MTWDEALDALDAELTLSRAVLDSGGSIEPLQDFVPPPGLGPLPVELVPRVHALLAATQELARDLERRLGATRRELAMLDRMRPRESAESSYVDSAV